MDVAKLVWMGVGILLIAAIAAFMWKEWAQIQEWINQILAK